MNNSEIQNAFRTLSTALIADACVKLQVNFRVGPSIITSIKKGMKIAGHITPVKHNGSVDIFLEAIDKAKDGNILYIDNSGRNDEACIGDLTVLETKQAGLIGMVVWGCHRDSKELSEINFPVFSTGKLPVGPRRTKLETPESREVLLEQDQIFDSDVMFADDDGIVVISDLDLDRVLEQALEIYLQERKQVEKLLIGLSLRQQFHFSDYLQIREKQKDYTFRDHLHKIGGAIEE